MPSINELIRRGIVRLPDGAPAGAALEEELPDELEELEGEETDTPTEEKPVEEQPAAEEEVSEEKPEGDPSWMAEAKKAGWNQPEPAKKEAPAPAPALLNPLERAYKEAADGGYEHDMDRIYKRAFEIDMEARRTEMMHLQKPQIQESYVNSFRENNLPEDMVGDFVDLALSYGPDGLQDDGKRSAALTMASGVTLLNAIKEPEKRAKLIAHLQALETGPAPKQPKPETAPRGGGGGTTYSADQKEAIQLWSNTFNGGKAPTAEQLAQIKKEGWLD